MVVNQNEGGGAARICRSKVDILTLCSTPGLERLRPGNTKAPAMGYLRCLPPTAILASLLVGPVARTPPSHLLPTRDVDIVYDVTLHSQPRVRERVRWLAAEQLERVDGPHKSTTIFDRRTHQMTLLTSADRSFLQLDMLRQPEEPAPEVTLVRGNDLLLRVCIASTGLGPKTRKRAPCASRRMACCCGFSSTTRRFPRRVR